MGDRKLGRTVVTALVIVGIAFAALYIHEDRQLIMTDSTHERIVYLPAACDTVFGTPVVKLLFDEESRQLQLITDRPQRDSHLALGLAQGSRGEVDWGYMAHHSNFWKAYSIYLYALIDEPRDLYIVNSLTLERVLICR